MAHATHASSAVHETAVQSEPLDAPASAESAVQFVAALKLTEREVRAVLAAREVSEAERGAGPHASVQAIADAFAPRTVTALTADPHLEVDAQYTDYAAMAARVYALASALDKLDELHARASGTAQLDADVLARFADQIAPVIKLRARANSAVRHTYATLLAYHHARHPGHHSASAAASPAPTPAPGRAG